MRPSNQGPRPPKNVYLLTLVHIGSHNLLLRQMPTAIPLTSDQTLLTSDRMLLKYVSDEPCASTGTGRSHPDTGTIHKPSAMANNNAFVVRFVRIVTHPCSGPKSTREGGLAYNQVHEPYPG